MEESAYIGGSVVGVAYLVAGVRLLQLSARTRETPEQLLAATLLLWGLAYVCWQTPLVLEDESLFSRLYVGGRILTDAGTITFALFLRLVFRGQSHIALWLVAMIASGLTLGVAGSIWVGDPEAMYPLSNPWWWLEWLAVVVAMGWMGVEGLHHYGMSQQRRRLGLCDRLTCNRYLLWGVTGVLWVIYEFSHVAQQAEFEATHAYSASLDAVVSILEIIPIGLIWLVFFPPTVYKRWIDGADSPIEAAKR